MMGYTEKKGFYYYCYYWNIKVTLPKNIQGREKKRKIFLDIKWQTAKSLRFPFLHVCLTNLRTLKCNLLFKKTSEKFSEMCVVPSNLQERTTFCTQSRDCVYNAHRKAIESHKTQFNFIVSPFGLPPPVRFVSFLLLPKRKSKPKDANNENIS